MIEIVHETPEHASALESLLDRAFGPDRWSRVSYRLRENNKAVRELCFIALEGAQPVAVVRFFPLRVGEAAALLLGPVAVAPERQGHGIGSAIMRTALAAAVAARHTPIIAVGEPEFLGRFGFVAAQGLEMPGPVETRRLLVLTGRGGTVVAGPVRRPATASALRATTLRSTRRAAAGGRPRQA